MYIINRRNQDALFEFISEKEELDIDSNQDPQYLDILKDISEFQYLIVQSCLISKY